MVEANSLRGQFRGWPEQDRDNKVIQLANVIRYFNPVSFEFYVSRAEYTKIIKPLVPRGIGNPYFVCCFGVVSTVARALELDNVDIPVDFIFDRQDGLSADIALSFDYMKKISRPKRGNLSQNLQYSKTISAFCRCRLPTCWLGI